MPTYTYRCKDCGHQFDKRQRMAEEPLTECPVCSGHIRRVVNSVGIVFKGSGFYVTDNRNGNSANGASKTPATHSDKKSETKAKSEDASPAASKPEKEQKAAASVN